MLPPEPPRFSTTTVWPSTSCSGAATARAITSAAPPGGKLTTILTGLLGHACASAAGAAASAARASTAARHAHDALDRFLRCIGCLLWILICTPRLLAP